MAKKNITIDDLAMMVNKGFEKTATIEIMQKGFEKTATKDDLFDLEKKFDKRFDKIEKIILDDHRERIEKLESKVQYLENMLNLPAKG